MVSTTNKLPALFSHFDVREFTPFDTIFADALKDLFPEWKKRFPQGSAYPKVNVVDYSDRVEIEAELAGLTKDDVDVKIEDGVLCISGQSSREGEQDKEGRYLVRELKRSFFQRSFLLGDEFDQERVKASFDNGILTIVISKIEPEKPKARSIQIE